jgi:hypothetical protein
MPFSWFLKPCGRFQRHPTLLFYSYENLYWPCCSILSTVWHFWQCESWSDWNGKLGMEASYLSICSYAILLSLVEDVGGLQTDLWSVLLMRNDLWNGVLARYITKISLDSIKHLMNSFTVNFLYQGAPGVWRIIRALVLLTVWRFLSGFIVL